MSSVDSPVEQERPRAFVETIAGVELQWSERGAGSNVVVLHGLSDSERSWWPVMAELGQRHRVLGLDLPGCGLSGRPNAGYGLDWQARVVAAWLDRLKITQCDVVAHSYGGGVALWLLLYKAALIRRLALVAPGGLGRDVALELRLASLPFFVERWGQPLMGAVSRLQLYLNGRSLSSEHRAQLLRLNIAPGTARAFARTVRDVINWRGQTRHFLKRAAEVPVLPAMQLFWGERDRIIPIRHGEELVAALENCTLKRFPGAGHFLHWERTHELSQALLAYLAAPHIPRAALKAPRPEFSVSPPANPYEIPQGAHSRSMSRPACAASGIDSLSMSSAGGVGSGGTAAAEAEPSRVTRATFLPRRSRLGRDGSASFRSGWLRRSRKPG